MPGMELDFKCHCGFNVENVTEGATQKGHYLVVLCLECHRLFSIWKKDLPPVQDSTVPNCKRCGKPLMPLTAPEAWSPSSLQKKFPDYEPWGIDEGTWFDRFDDEPTENEMVQIKGIRVLCPRCRKHSVDFETVLFGD